MRTYGKVYGGRPFLFFPLSALRNATLQINLRADLFAAFPADNHLVSMDGNDPKDTFLIFVLFINVKFKFFRLVHGTSFLGYIIKLFALE